MIIGKFDKGIFLKCVNDSNVGRGVSGRGGGYVIYIRDTCVRACVCVRKGGKAGVARQQS